MSRITVLGGCGAVGSVAVRTLARHPEFSEVVVADFNIEKAQKLAKGLGQGASAVGFDALDTASVKRAIQGSDVVLNCVGPFYATVKPIFAAVLASGIHYVDVCDDVDVTIEILDMDQRAKEAGVSALIGMGSSPGVTNILARYAVETLLDTTDAIDIFHTHGGEPVEGEGVIGHRFHCMSMDIPMYLDGRLHYVKYFEEDGIAMRERFVFPMIGESLLYPYPHPEQITLPRYLKVRRVTNKGSVLPEAYYNLIRDICHLGLHGGEPVNVKGQKVVPYDFSIAFILRERERLLKEVNFGQQRGCVTVTAKGRKDGKPCEYRFHMASLSQALGEGTGIPAAMGAIAMNQGKVQGRGVLPPEACIDPVGFLSLIGEFMKADSTSRKDGVLEGFLVERVDEHGNVKRVDL